MFAQSGNLRRVEILIVLVTLAVPLSAQRLNVHLYAGFQGLPQSQVMALAQDARGFIWLGTYGGLSRYNGRDFRTLTTNEGLPHNAVMEIAADPSGGLWVGTAGGGVCRVDDGVVTAVYRRPERLIDDMVNDLEPGGPGTVWVAMEGGITRIEGDRSIHYTTTDGLPRGDVWKVLRRRDGSILAGTTRGIYVLEGSRFQLLVPTEGPHAGVRELLEAGDRLYAGTERGLYEYGGNGLRPIRVVEEGQQPIVYALRLDGHGTLWIATSRGVFSLEDGRVRHLVARNGIPEDPVYSILLDREHDLWFGTDNGLLKLVPGPFTAFRREDGLPHDAVRAMAVDRNGRLWLGTRKGLARFENGHIVTVARRSLASRRIYSLESLPGGGILVGTRRGLFLVRGDRVVRRWRKRDGLASEHVLCLMAEPEGEAVWVATHRGIAVWRAGRIVPPPVPELASVRAMALAFDRDHRLWIGLGKGGVLITDGARILHRFGAREGLSDQTVWSLSPDDAGGMWIGTNGDGAFHVVNETMDHWSVHRGLINDFVWQVLAASGGDTWFYTSRGLDRLHGGTIRHYGSGDGLISLEGMAGATVEDPQGRLWFASTLGAMRYDPARDRTPPPPPTVVVDAASSSEQGAIHPGSRLSTAVGTITFKLAVPTFRDEDHIRFRHRLLPVEHAWSEPEHANVVRLAGVAPGSYRFEAIAEDTSGHRSATVMEFPFSVRPPWWRTPLAELLDCLVLIGLIVLAFKVRTRRLERERNRLEQVVEERTRELRRLASTDELTGTANRREFAQALQRELQRLSRSPEDARLSLILLDLDGFKEINDTHGHDAGDRLLAAIGKRLRERLRSTDVVARFGGDEFAIILPQTTRNGAQRAALKLIQAVARIKVPVDDREIGVTASAGFAVVASTADVTGKLDQLIAQADMALYAAKRAGGNRVFSLDGTWQ